MQSATKPTPTPTATATATAQPEQVIAKPNIPPLSAHGAVPASVSTQTGASVIAASQQQSIAHNSLVNANTGRTVGGKKRSKKAKAKRSKKAKAKRSKKAKAKRSKKAKAKRSKKAKAKRSKRGGADPTPTPTPTPTNTTPTPKLATVPQFSGQQHAGANQASINLNHGGMLMSSQAAYDNVNAPASIHRLP
jgi:hypothetical protein